MSSMLKMDVGILVAGEAYKSDFAFFLRFGESFSGTVRAE